MKRPRNHKIQIPFLLQACAVQMHVYFDRGRYRVIITAPGSQLAKVDGDDFTDAVERALEQASSIVYGATFGRVEERPPYQNEIQREYMRRVLPRRSVQPESVPCLNCTPNILCESCDLTRRISRTNDRIVYDACMAPIKEWSSETE